MKDITLHFKAISEKEVPLELLLEADPSEDSVKKYLTGAQCFGAFVETKIVAVCVVNRNSNGCAEIFNIAVLPEKQRQGIGTKLLKFVIGKLTDAGEAKIELGTGTFGYQLLFYQRLGFRVESVWKDYFSNHCDEPILIDGVQLKDMLRLGLVI